MASDSSFTAEIKPVKCLLVCEGGIMSPRNLEFYKKKSAVENQFENRRRLS